MWAAIFFLIQITQKYLNKNGMFVETYPESRKDSMGQTILFLISFSWMFETEKNFSESFWWGFDESF